MKKKTLYDEMYDVDVSHFSLSVVDRKMLLMSFVEITFVLD